MEQNTSAAERHPRIPMFVQVSTDPPLPECWSVDMSRSGIGLIAAPEAERHIREGDSLVLAFDMPGSGSAVHALGRVMWLYPRRGGAHDLGETALGVQFSEIAAADRVDFEHYLLEHRYQVAVAYASPEEHDQIRATLGHMVHLFFVGSEAELVELVQRSDISTVLLMPSAESAIEGIHREMVELERARLLPPDSMPAFVFCGEGSSDPLVQLFNDRRLFCVIRPPFEEDAIRDAVHKACESRGRRTEQRRVSQALERALARQKALEQKTATRGASVHRLVFASPLMESVLERVRRVAPHKVSVLLQGKTGTGKEVLATLIHELSPRAQSSLVIQDCGVLTETLLESELFGHVRGAFTGAVADSLGLFVMADGGTVFLDEIENTTPDLQTKLLRVIETGMVRPVGGTKICHVDVRVIAASNRDLREEVKAGRFREDLYYRLNAFQVRIPPLRQRPEDVLLLADHFLKLSCEKLDRRTPGLTSAARDALLLHDWPGNIRELRNAIEAAVLMCGDGEPVDADLLPESVLGLPGERDEKPALSLRLQVQAHERDLIERALRLHHGVLRRAALQLQTNPVTLRRKAIRYGLISERSRGA